MKSKIYKQPLTDPTTEFEIPAAAEVISAGTDLDNNPCIWYKRPHQDSSLRNRTIVVIMTGEVFDDTDLKFLGTFKSNHLMCHAFEKL